MSNITSEKTSKKAYAAPSLVCYGGIADLTGTGDWCLGGKGLHGPEDFSFCFISISECDDGGEQFIS